MLSYSVQLRHGRSLMLGFVPKLGQGEEVRVKQSGRAEELAIVAPLDNVAKSSDMVIVPMRSYNEFDRRGYVYPKLFKIF